MPETQNQQIFVPSNEAAPSQTGPSGPVEIDGIRVYPVNHGEHRWAVQSSENKKKGADSVIGDTLWRTFPEAEQYAREVAARERARAAVRKAQADEAARRTAAKASDDLNGFVDGMSPMQKGRVEKALSKLYRFGNGEVMSVRQRIERLHAAGKLELDAFEEPRIKPMSRRRFNNATLAEQRAHEEKMRKAGNKTTYLVSGSDLGKIAYDYARYLISKRKPDVGKTRQATVCPGA